jgi:hypothetical protein
MVAHLLVGLLSVPIQLFAAPPPPPPPPPLAVEKIDKVEQPGASELAESEDELWDSGEAPQTSYTEQPSRFVTGLAQTGAGLLGGIGFAFLGGFAGAALCQGGSGFDVLGCVIGLAALGYGLGTPISVWAVGEWMGWDGSLLATFAGFALGVIVLSVVLQGASTNNGQDAVLWTSLIGLPAGAAIGYQLSADWPKSAGVTAVPKVTSIPIVYFEF